MTEVRASTQQHLDIYDIDQDLLILKNGSARLVLEVTAVNFNLLSEVEQDAIIAAYSSLLNSLSFPIQVIVRSKRMDISLYLKKLEEVEKEQINHHLKKRIGSYRNYVEQLISKNEVLDKSFFIAIPYQETLLTSSENALKKIFSRRKRVILNKDAILKKAKVSLEPRREHLIKQLNKVGVRAQQLKTKELVELFYDIYNPDSAREQRLTQEAEDYTTPLVRPAVES
jgi:Fe2+ transport system protein B